MRKITGFQRFQLALIWMRRGRQGEVEDFIKSVCSQKGLEYVAPPPTNRLDKMKVVKYDKDSEK